MTEAVLTSAKTMSFVPTTKPDEAKQFYSEILGLEFLHGDGFALVFAVYEGLSLRVQSVPAFTPQPFTIFGWQIDDIEGAVTDLATRGVLFENYGLPSQDAHGICAFPNGDKVAWFKDPDGNVLSIAQMAE